MQGADVTQPSEYGVAGGALEPMVPQRCFIAKRRAGFQRRAADTFDANYFGNRDTNTEYLRDGRPGIEPGACTGVTGSSLLSDLAL